MPHRAPALLLPPRRRRDFAWPRGVVCRGPSCYRLLIGASRGLACVGDVVSSQCLAALREGLNPELLVLVVDGKTRRRETVVVGPLDIPGSFRVHEVRNPPGSVSLEALSLLCNLARSGAGRHLVRVAGEEDMLALAMLECMPSGSLVVYGIPGLGMALVPVSQERRLDVWIRHSELEPGIAEI